MKLLKRFSILLLVVSVLLLFFVGMANVQASAETPEINVEESVGEFIDSAEEMQNSSVFEAETSEYFGVIPETSASKWFEEKVQPYLMMVLSVLVAFFATVAWAITPISRSAKKVKAAVDDIKQSNADNKTTQNQVTALQSSNDEWKAEVKAELKAELDRRLLGIEKETHETNVGVKKLLDVDRIVYEDNPSMVSNGTSHKVAEVLHHEEA